MTDGSTRATGRPRHPASFADQDDRGPVVGRGLPLHPGAGRPRDRWPKLRALLGVNRLSMPDADTALAVTGYVRGMTD
jgi:hypothetical protein